MKILYIYHNEPDETVESFMKEQEKDNEIDVFDLRASKDYARLLDLMEASNTVISW